MDNFVALIYGLVQGATEYLPVSSSAHLALLPHALGQQDPGLAFDVFLHIGTLLATAIYFFKDWLLILKNPLPNSKLTLNAAKTLTWVHLIIGTLPAVVVGALLNGWIQEHTRSLWVMGITLPVFGILLWWVDRQSPKSRKLENATLKDLFWIGCMQTLSLVPGVSRSGSTMTAARLCGFERQDSAKISFLLSLPITLGAIVYEMKHWDDIVNSLNGVSPLIMGMISAFFFGSLAIHFLIKWLAKASFAVFAIYRIGIGLLIFILGT